MWEQNISWLGGISIMYWCIVHNVSIHNLLLLSHMKIKTKSELTTLFILQTEMLSNTGTTEFYQTKTKTN